MLKKLSGISIGRKDVLIMDKSFFVNKKICALGDRDGIPGPAIAECMKTVGGEVLFTSTECFV